MTSATTNSEAKYIDVNVFSELPSAPIGKRYLEFIGGGKEFRCFIVDANLSRTEFMHKHEYLLDDCLKPILEHNNILVRQDTSYALPGFYIVSLPFRYKYLDDVDDVLAMNTAIVVKKVRSAMRKVLGIEQVHFRCEEKRSASYAIHYWMLPIGQEHVPQDVVDAGIVREYLSRFNFSIHRSAIFEANSAMRDELRKQIAQNLSPVDLA